MSAGRGTAASADATPLAAVPVLRTARLVLRAFAERDLVAYAAMCADAEVMRHVGAGGPIERGLAWRQMAMFVGEWTLHGYGMWAIEAREDGRLVGRAGFLHPPGWPEAELGWLLARDAWGRGYATEAVRAAREHGRARLGLAAPISLIRPDNTRSIALAERVGATLESRTALLGGEALVYRHAA